MKFKEVGARAYVRQVDKLNGYCGIQVLGQRFPSKTAVSGHRAPFQTSMRIISEVDTSPTTTRPRLHIPDFDLTTKPNRQRSSVWYKYANGTRSPPVDDDPESLVNRVDRQCRGTKAWIATPFWSLFESESFHFDGLMALIERLPEKDKDRLSQSRDINGTKAKCFRELNENDLIAFLSLTGPMGLGTLACCLRMAQLTGNRRLERYVGLLLLFRLTRMRKHHALSEDFDLIWSEIEKSLPRCPPDQSSNDLLAPYRMRRWHGFAIPEDLQTFTEEVVLKFLRHRRKSRGRPFSTTIYDLMDLRLGEIK